MQAPESHYQRTKRLALAGDEKAQAWLKHKKAYMQKWLADNPERRKFHQQKSVNKLKELIVKCNSGDLSELDKLLKHREKHKLLRRKNRANKRGDGELRGLQKTHCKRGHELSSDNVYFSSRGDRECRTCSLARNKARYFKEKAAAAATPPAPAALVTV